MHEQAILDRLRLQGVEEPHILAERYRAGYPDYLIASCGFRGWWKSGESIEDIRWYEETTTGWDDEVSISPK